MSTAPVKRDSIDDLWARAVAQVPDKYKQNINFSSDAKNDALQGMHTEMETARKKAIDSRWKLTRKNRETVIIRDVVEKIVRWVNLFSKVGDAVIQYDPAHAALPWAAVRFVLQLAVNDSNTLSSVVEGLARIAELICRYAVVEDLYLRHVSKARSELERALTQLYADILCYLSAARQYVEERTAKRVLKGALLPNTELETGLDTIRKSETDVHHCQALVAKEDQDQADAQTEAQFDQVHAKLIDLQASFDAPFQRMDDGLKKIQDALDTTERNNILKWCSPHPYLQHHKLAKEGVLPGTGQWLLSDPVLKDWKDDSASNILWLHGKPGAGKTKLVSIVIEDACKGFAAGNNAPPVFFYCSRDEADTRGDPNKIVASIARQLSSLEPGKPLLKPTKTLYDEVQAMDQTDAPLLMEESYKLVLELIEWYPLTVIVLDALDECTLDNRSTLLDFSENIIQESNNLVKVFISSRDDADIKFRLRDYPSIEVNGERNGDDIALFIKDDVEKRTRSGRLLRHSNSTSKSSIKSLVIDKVTEGADGMFRWASMQLQYLCTIDDKDIKRHLGHLSEQNLDTLYSKIYETLSTRPGEFARTIFKNSLHWLFCAQRNLSPEEFYAAVSIGLEVSDRAFVTEDRVLDICNNFVIFDSELETFRFAHLSVREFLEQRSGYESSTTHALAAEMCLRVVISTSQHYTSQESALSLNMEAAAADRFPDGFRRYSDLYWAAHCKLALGERRKNTLKDMLQNFLSSSGKATSDIEKWAIRLRSYPRNDDDDFLFFLWDSELEFPNELEDLELRDELAPATGLFVSCAFDFDDYIEGIVDEYLQKMACINKQGRTPLQVAARNGSCAVLRRLLDPHGPNVTITEEFVKAAAGNASKGKEVMELLLNRAGQRVSITAAVLEKAVANSGSGRKVVQLLLEKRPADVSMSASVVKAAARNYKDGKHIMELLLKHDRANIPVVELAKEIASSFDEEVLSHFLGERRADVSLLAAITAGAASNFSNGKAIMKFLISKYRDKILAAEATIALIAKDFDKPTVEHLFYQSRTDFLLTKTVVEAVASNYRSKKDVMKCLLSQCKSNMPAEPVIVAIIRNFDRDVITCLLDQCGTEVLLTESFAEDVIEASYYNSGNSNNIMKLLLNRCKVEAPISNALVASIVQRFDHEVIECLLDRLAASVLIDMKLARAVEWNYRLGSRTMKLLLNRCRIETLETEAVGAFIAQHFDPEIMECLLESPENDISITHEMIKAAAANSESSKVMALLLDRYNVGVSNTEEIVKVAVKNRGSGKEILSLLLDRYGAGIEVTQGVVKAAKANFQNGADMIKVLLTKYGADKFITETAVLEIARHFDQTILEDLVQAKISVTKSIVECFARRSDQEVMACLLDRPGVDVLITESTVQAAAWNSSNGKGVMRLLLGRCTLEKPTEPIVLAIAREFDQDVMAYLLDRGDVDVGMTKPLVEAIARNYRSGKAVMALLLDQCKSEELTEPVVEAIARKFDQAIMARLLDRGDVDISITKSCAEAISGNDSGEDVMKLLLVRCRVDMPLDTLALAITKNFDQEVMTCLLDRPGTELLITKEIVETAFWYSRYGNTIIRLLLNRCRADRPISEAIVVKLVRNFDQDVLTCLLDKHGQNMPLTEDIVLEIVGRRRQDSMAYLLRTRGNDVPITRATLASIARHFDQDVIAMTLDLAEAAAPIAKTLLKAVVEAAVENLKNGKEVMALLLDRYREHVKITESIIKTAIENEKNGGELISLLLDRRQADVVVTEEVVEAAAENTKNGKEILKLMLNRCRQEDLVSSLTVAAIARHFGPEVMTCLLDRPNTAESVTEAVVNAAAQNWEYRNAQGKAIVMLLIDTCRNFTRNFDTFEAVEAIAQNFDRDVMESLLNRLGPDVSLTEGVVRATACNIHGEHVIALLFERCRMEMPVPEAVAIAIARNFNQEVTMDLIHQHGANIHITEALLLAITERFDHEMLRCLLDLDGAKIVVTKAVVKAAAIRIVYGGTEIMRLLLDQPGASTSLTEAIVDAASGRWADGEKVMLSLLGSWGAHVQVTNELVEVSAENEKYGEELIRSILDQRKENVQLTEEVVKAAAENEACGEKVMTLLLDQRKDVQITEEMLKVVANEACDTSVMNLLLDRLGEDIQITEEVVKAAASNECCGDEIMTLLLDQRGEDVQITEEVVKAAASNECCGDEVMMLLLDQRGEDVQITGEVVEAAAENKECGYDVMALLLDRRGEDSHIPDDVRVAIGKHWSGIRV